MEEALSRAGRKRKVGKSKPYSIGELNKLIDSLIHPLSKKDKRFILVDGLLHGLVEQDPPKSVRKFMKYNLPVIMKELAKNAGDKDEGECKKGKRERAS